MNFTVKVLHHAMLLLVLCFGFKLLIAQKPESIPLETIQESEDFQGDDLSEALSQFAHKHGIRIALEVGEPTSLIGKDKLSQNQPVCLHLEIGTLADALDAIKSAFPQLNWRVDADVVVFFSKDTRRDVLIPDILDTEIADISFGKTSRKTRVRPAILMILLEVIKDEALRDTPLRSSTTIVANINRELHYCKPDPGRMLVVCWSYGKNFVSTVN